MKKRVVLFLAILAIPLVTWALAAPRDDQWKKVEQAMQKGLPRTAIEHLEPIIASALKDKAYAEALKAIAKKIALEGNIQGNKPEEKITRLQAEIAKAPPELVPLMDTILANWYWHYFQHNRWRFMQRTTTATPPGKDFTTWDLPRLFAEIDKQFTKALAAEKLLKATPVSQYNALLEKGNVPDAYRPTLYDFLAHNALSFYTSPEQAGTKAEDAFELTADSPIFSAADDFLSWTPNTTDTTSTTLKAIRLYQDLLKFHQNDQDKTAFLDADLLRLQFGHNKAFGEEKNPRYAAALHRFTEKHATHEISARARALWAGVLQQDNDLVEARKIALQGSQAFPNTAGGNMCFNIVQQIEAKSANVTTERVWNEPWPNITVRYRNLTKAYFRIIKADYHERLKLAVYRPEYLTDAEQKALVAKRPTVEWSVNLTPTDDYQERVQKVTPPKNLKPGFYFLVAGHDPEFGPQNNHVTYTNFWVSNLALVMRNHQGEGVIEGFVLDSLSGEPIPNAEIKAWYRGMRNERVAVNPTKSDQNGLFRFTGIRNQSYLVLARAREQELSSAHDFYVYNYDRASRPFTRTIFFTDRSLYRPGQTIQYKGICIRTDQDKDNYEIIPNQMVTVIFQDRNGKEITRYKARSNDYGSFSGSFTAPTDRLMGQMTIRTESEPHGAATLNVEEYKRPKFQVTVEKPKGASKLNSVVSLQGKAMAYTGAAIDHAKVGYRVVRQVRYPIWWGWYYWWRQPRTDSQEIAHGYTTTAVDGTFKINFLAKPDPSVAEKDEPIFHYSIHADVTDTTGETRSGNTTVDVGYTALQAALNTDEWQTPDKAMDLAIRTTTLDGEAQTAEGTVKVYRLQQPDKVQRAELGGHHYFPVYMRGGKIKEPDPDPSNPNSWALGEVAFEKGFTTDKEGNAKLNVKLEAGIYRALLETQDRFGKKVTAKLPLRVLAPDAKSLNIKVANVVAAAKWNLEPGSEFSALWGTGYDEGRAFVEVEHRRKMLQSFWTQAGQTQVQVKQAVTEAMRGGFTFRVTMVRENRAYIEQKHVEVPWTNKDLKIRWEHFVSKLEPGVKETWTAIITGPEAKKWVAEMVAALYDQSLDQYKPHNWLKSFGVFRHDHSNIHSMFENQLQGLQHIHGGWPMSHRDTNWTYRSFPFDIIGNFWGYEFFGGRGGYAVPGGMAPGAPRMEMAKSAQMANGRQMDRANALGAASPTEAQRRKSDGGAEGGETPSPGPKPDLGKVSARKNLNETAFFFPHLLSDKDGEVKLQFTMPEALTQWRFLGFAHDKELRSGYLESSVVTAKDLMVQPHPPRFLREGDLLEYTVKVTNMSKERQSGTVRLTFTDARTSKEVDVPLGNTKVDQPFDVPAKESRTYSWQLKVPDDMGFLSYKAVASTGKLSDGEEGYLPVLARRIFVTESLPLPIRGPIQKTFAFARLKEAGKSDTLHHKALTVQMVSHPSWYAVMALPYLMEFPYECTEQTFNRLYANALARHIANSDPKIRKVFDQWKGTPALDSPLTKNKELLAVALEETPWVRQAEAESQARRNVGVLFDDNRLTFETNRLQRQLAELQHPDGAWSWFPGGPPNDYITLYITTGYGRMRHLGVNIETASAIKALQRLDNWIDRVYQEIVRRGHQDKNHLSPTIALYLYGRSFFLPDRAIEAQHKQAVEYFLGQARSHWLKLANRQSQAHLALALNRFGDKATAQGIMRSIKERSVTNEEMGMFWRELELSWWWYRAPIETQAMMIEAFDEVMNDAPSVEECKVWLLKQKHTQDWKTTKATADACYALLLRGSKSPLVSDALVEVKLGDMPIKADKVEAGTGFYEKRFVGSEVKPQMGDITVKKTDEGVSWGSVHWQYMEDMSKVTAYEGTPLTLKKKLFTKAYTKKGPVLTPVANGQVKVGDELVVRLELRVDRDMEYVHLKDQRGSGTEPVNVLSRYRYQDGLGYYESTRDVASHFFMDYLPKGAYVFEYSVRVVHKGQYQTGVAQIQCMYAPEFNSHSESFVLNVK